MSSEGIDASFPLELIKQEDLEREAKKLREAKRLQDQAKRTPIGTPDSTTGRKDIFGAGGTGKTLPRNFAAKDKTSRSAFVKQNEFKKLREEVKATKDKQKELENITKQFDSGSLKDMLVDPRKFLDSGIAEVLKFAGPLAGASAAATTIFKMIEEAFGEGGILDIRKKILDAIRTIGPLQALIDLAQGTVFFSAETQIFQGAPTVSNTERLRDGHLRFSQMHIGD